MSKGQGLSMNVIIIAAISLVVLVVLIFMFTGGFKGFQSGTGCEAFNGQCFSESTQCGSGSASNHPFVGGYVCKDKNLPKCCVKTPGT